MAHLGLQLNGQFACDLGHNLYGLGLLFVCGGGTAHVKSVSAIHLLPTAEFACSA